MSTARGLVVVANQVQPQQCSLYRSHSCAVLDDHHICPASWWVGKPDTPMRLLCPNCHYGTHAAIDGLLAGRDVSALPPRVVALARQGLDIAARHGLTPAPTL
ncbi:hypothetical protein OG762_37170 [Streptomyces sp. NBC_01136]|uniref:hypothetical protein n=1 Tax=Streptomyces sp. NBC_01136 TaxID=2903754 RepID=UPI0038702176|nr:hypothetical protein OG762_37170 [Streptomyces sp. NBC_01136]